MRIHGSRIGHYSLPQSDRPEELEELSFLAFKNALPEDRFCFRDERGNKDKGVDASIELKEGRSYLNFRAQIQLKGTDSLNANSDGSVPISVNVSNLNYLLNAHSALYVLYIAPHDELRFVWARDEQRRLDSINTEWDNQKTVTLLFKDLLTSEEFDLIYERIFREAEISRNAHCGVVALTQIRLGPDGWPSGEQKVERQLVIAQWLAVIRDDPSDATAWKQLAEAYYAEEELSKALGAINKAWAIGPHENKMKSVRACILAEYGKAYGGPKHFNLEAISLFESLREHSNIQGYADYNIGNCYSYVGENSKAIVSVKLSPPFHLSPQA